MCSHCKLYLRDASVACCMLWLVPRHLEHPVQGSTLAIPNPLTLLLTVHFQQRFAYATVAARIRKILLQKQSASIAITRQKCRPRTIDKREKERGKRGRGGEGEGGRGQERERGRGIARERVSPSGSELFSRCNCATCKCICICKCCCCCCRAYLLDTLFAVVTEVASSCCNTFLRIPIALGGWRKAQRRRQATPSELVATNVSCSLYHFIYFLGRCSRNGTRKTTFDSAQSVVFLCIFCSIFFLSLYVSFSGHIRHLICDKMKLSLSLTSRNSSSRMFMHARDAVSCSVALHSSLTVPLSLSLPLSLLSYSLFNYHKRQFCNRISVASWAESASRG